MGKLIRILVANRPRLMRELVLDTLGDQGDIEIVGEVSNDSDIGARVGQTLPDFLLIALDRPGTRPEICDTILRQYPALGIIAVAAEQNCSVHYWASFHVHSEDIESSADGILAAVRKKTRQVGGAA